MAPRPWARLASDVLAASVALAGLQVVGLSLEPAVALALVTAWSLILAVTGCYSDRPFGEPFGARARRVLHAGAALGLVGWVSFVVVGPLAAPGLLVPATAAMTAAGLLAALVSSHPVTAGRATRVVVVGHPADVRRAIHELKRAPHGCEVGAVCLSRAVLGHFPELPVHIGVHEAAHVAATQGVDAVLALPGPDLPPVLMRRLQWQAHRAGTHFYVGTGLLDVAPFRMSSTQAGGIGVLHVRPASYRGPRRLLKEVVERLLAVLGLVVLLPALLAVCVAIRIDSPGPLIFRQQRVGRDGRHFTMYKFRTMTQSAEQDLASLAGRNDADGVLFKLRADPRITRVGSVLRRYSIDELPQLWNVVAGQMSLVGPRPALPQEVARYGIDPSRRLAVKPGLTGLWQVSGRSDLSWEESVRLDVQYVDNWTLSLDLTILCRTLGAVLDNRGAY